MFITPSITNRTLSQAGLDGYLEKRRKREKRVK
jgi:hypothetical protein